MKEIKRCTRCGKKLGTLGTNLYAWKYNGPIRLRALDFALCPECGHELRLFFEGAEQPNELEGAGDE